VDCGDVITIDGRPFCRRTARHTGLYAGYPLLTVLTMYTLNCRTLGVEVPCHIWDAVETDRAVNIQGRSRGVRVWRRAGKPAPPEEHAQRYAPTQAEDVPD